MAKSKRSPALFELIDKRHYKRAQKLAVPKWFRRPSQPQAESKPAEPPPQAKGETPAAPQPAPPPARPASEGRPPVFQWGGGRVVLTLNPVSAAVAVGVVGLAIFSGFLIGRQMGPSPAEPRQLASADDAIEKALQQPADPSVLDVGRDKATLMGRVPPSPATEPPAGHSPASDGTGREAGPVRWDPGLNYIVIQTFQPEDQAAAVRVQQWLVSEYDLATRLVKAGRKWQLVTSAGFDFSKPSEKEACQKFIEDLRSLGDDCARLLTQADLPVYRLNDPFAKKFAD